jgi:AcrR family transcriptional regulator
MFVMEFECLEIVKQDGRFKRSERSRQAIIDAMIVSMEKGCYIPTAQQVADQAGISIRTVFRHFSEMELLYKEITEIQKPSYAKHFIDQDLTGSIKQRIDRLVDARIAGYLQIFHLEKATHALLWRSAVIRHNYRNSQKLLRSLLFKMLPELATKTSTTHEIADSLTSFEYFERLHTFQELSIDECKNIMKSALNDLLANKKP